MNVKKCLMIGVVLGIVANVIDFIVQGTLLAGFYTGAPFRQDTNMAWMVLGDFVAAFVFTWVYLKVAPAFAAGPVGGATMGFYAGVLVTFPANIFLHLMIANFPYGLSWIWTIYGIIWYVVLGAIAGAMNKK
ncbi:MAG: hypothetical protein IMZ55_11535 [Acidobacteria bacterium]|nr:hypothetical protein [Acidobacteriota bacterium]